VFSLYRGGGGHWSVQKLNLFSNCHLNKVMNFDWLKMRLMKSEKKKKIFYFPKKAIKYSFD
jgi:hypothetical protein